MKIIPLTGPKSKRWGVIGWMQLRRNGSIQLGQIQFRKRNVKKKKKLCEEKLVFVWKTQQKNHVKHEHDWTDQCLSSQTWCSQVLPVTRLLLDDPSCQSHGAPYYIFCDVDSIIFGLNGCILFLCEGWVWIGFKLIHSYTKIFYLYKWKLVFAFKKNLIKFMTYLTQWLHSCLFFFLFSLQLLFPPKQRFTVRWQTLNKEARVSFVVM